MTHTSNIPICRMNSNIFAVFDFSILLPDTGYIFPLTIQGRIPMERGKNRLRPTTPTPATTQIPKARCPLSGKLPRPILLLLGSVHRYGVRPINRYTLADGNESRDFRIYQDLGYTMISTTRKLYHAEELAVITQVLTGQ